MVYRILAVFIVGLCTATWALDLTVDVDYTKYKGAALPNGVSQWLGMRYAAPPLGNLRFRAPADPPRNTTVQVANTHGPICLSTGAHFPSSGTSEDCLFLDVYAPSGATASSLLPVFFWIQGGGFNSNSNPNYNGSGLISASEMNVVAVTSNYRVGPYGFLASKEVQANGDLNAGLLDQRKALEWVQKYISRFGGNPKHVVLGGASAGAVSILLHLTAFGGKPTTLFHGAIAESQGFPPQLTVAESQYQYTSLITRVGCQNATDSLACLRSLDISTLQNANIAVSYPGRTAPPLFMYSPIIDGTLVVDFLYRLFDQGRFVKVPIISGDDTNEGSVFTPADVNSSDGVTDFLANNYPGLTAEQGNVINSLYPKDEQFPGRGEFFTAASKAYGEIRYICPGIHVSSTVARFRNPSPNWNYHYNVLDPATVEAGLGVPHTVETSAVWGLGNTGTSGAPASYKTTNAAIIPFVQGYWTSFIRTFDPNVHRATGSPIWSPFGSNEQRILLQTNVTAMESVGADQQSRCAFLKSIGVALQQ